MNSLTPPTASTKYYAHIEIINPKLSDNRQTFLFKIKSTYSQVNALYIPVRVGHVSLNFIIIGSGMGGYYTSSGIPSSYLFARNSDMFLPATAGPTLIDFKNSVSNTAGSPFLYNPGDNTYKGCGAVKKNGNWIIETGACARASATIFITGFEYPL